MQAVKRISECLPDGGYDAKERRLMIKAMDLLKTKLKKEGACISDPQCASNEARILINLALGGREREVFLVVFLDSQHRIIDSAELFLGTINEAAVYPREVVKAALALNSAAVILAHNHPSGLLTPSDADKHITHKIKNALELVDITLLDHIIVGGDKNLSFAQRNIL